MSSGTVYEETAYAGEATSSLKNVSPYEEALDMVRIRLSSTYDAEQIREGGPIVIESLREISRGIYDEFNTKALHSNQPTIKLGKEFFIISVEADVLGMGPLEPLLKDPSVEDIAINGPKEVMVFKNGGWKKVEVSFESEMALLEILQRSIAHVNRAVNMVTPIADAILPRGERINIGVNPIASPSPSAVIRIPRSNSITLQDMTTEYDVEELDNAAVAWNTSLDEIYAGMDTGGMLSKTAARYLHAAVIAGLNIVVIGPTGVGKTTLLTALGRCIPTGNRILVIEDTPEINIYPGNGLPNNVQYFRTRPSSVDGLTPEISPGDLVRLALRQRPDALTLGESRGAEIFQLLNALNTGHKNGLTSIHADEVDDLFNRVFLMVGQSEEGRTLDAYRVADLIASTFHIAISLSLTRLGSKSVRIVKTIAETTGKVVPKDTMGVKDFALFEPEMQIMFRQSGEKPVDLQGPLLNSAREKEFFQARIPRSIYAPLKKEGEGL